MEHSKLCTHVYQLVRCDTIDTMIVSIPDLVLQRKAWASALSGIFNLAHVTK